MSFLIDYWRVITTVVAIAALFGVPITYKFVIEPWRARRAKEQRDSNYLLLTRSNFVPASDEETWMALPMMQRILHIKAVFIASLWSDLKRLEEERADNAERADYLLEEHGRLVRKIRHETERFIFAHRTFFDFVDAIKVELSSDYKEHLLPPIEFVPPTIDDNTARTA